VTDPRKLRPTELCRLLNSSPLGEVINEGQLRRHRTRAGIRLGGTGHVDLVRYIAWLVQGRHAPKREPENGSPPAASAEAAQGAAALGSRSKQVTGHGQKLSSRQEVLIAALLNEPTYASAAAKAGVAETTVYRWMHLPEFRTAYRQARRELVERAIGRVQAATGQAVETLVTIARDARRDGDRLRASVALLDHAFRGLAEANILHGDPDGADKPQLSITEVVKMLTLRIQQIDAAELPTSEKSRLTATLADALWRGIAMDDMDKRIKAIESVLSSRKGDKS